mgnify:CR=1 FL=1
MRPHPLIGWIVPVVLLALWEGAVRGQLLSITFLPAPSAVAVAGWRLLRSGALIASFGVRVPPRACWPRACAVRPTADAARRMRRAALSRCGMS